MIVSLTGFMGSGKSSVGAELATLLGFEFIDLDCYIEEKIGLSIKDIFEMEGEDGFRAIEAEALRDVVVMHTLTQKDLVLALGGGTIAIKGVRHLILEDTTCIYLETSPKTLRARLEGEGEGRPLLDENMENLLKAREEFYREAPISIQTDDHTIREVAQIAAEKFKKESI